MEIKKDLEDFYDKAKVDVQTGIYDWNVRDIQQKIGTEIFRKFDENFWCDITVNKIKNFIKSEDNNLTKVFILTYLNSGFWQFDFGCKSFTSKNIWIMSAFEFYEKQEKLEDLMEGKEEKTHKR